MSLRHLLHRIFIKLSRLTAEPDIPSIAQVESKLKTIKAEPASTPQSNLLSDSSIGTDAPTNLADLAPYVKKMAETGEGTDACLKLECLPVRVHYYSPIPDIYDLIERDIWNKVSDLAGINFNVEKQIRLLVELGKEFGKECDWPLKKTSDPYQFYLENNSFNYGCASSLFCMIRYWKPKRIIEIGSGNSSRVISAALTQNHLESSNIITEYIIVDPYPDELELNGMPNLTRVENKRVELLDPVFFNQLTENDMLFIDSSHSVKIGGDVNYLILQILPILAPGVVIHFHDIIMPYEYPKIYYTNPAFRMFWTESYLLQAFLAFNDKFDILLGMAFLMLNHLDKFRQAFPHFNMKDNETSASSFWIRRIS